MGSAGGSHAQKAFWACGQWQHGVSDWNSTSAVYHGILSRVLGPGVDVMRDFLFHMFLQ